MRAGKKNADSASPHLLLHRYTFESVRAPICTIIQGDSAWPRVKFFVWSANLVIGRRGAAATRSPLETRHVPTMMLPKIHQLFRTIETLAIVGQRCV